MITKEKVCHVFTLIAQWAVYNLDISYSPLACPIQVYPFLALCPHIRVVVTKASGWNCDLVPTEPKTFSDSWVCFFSPRRPGSLRIVTMLTENSERLCFFSGTCGASVRRRATSLCRLFLALSRAVFPTWSRAAIVNQSKPFFYFKLKILWIQSGTHMVLDCSVGTGLQQNLDGFLVVESGSNMKRRFPFLQ